MAKKKDKNVRVGPFLVAAFFCERTLEEKDESLSAIRMIDRITISLDSTAPADIPSEQNRLPVMINGLVSFKTGGSPGPHTVRCELISPSGKTDHEAFKQSYSFPENDIGGINVRLGTTIFIKKGGLFRMNVYLDDQFFTQVPVEIVVERSQAPVETSSPRPSQRGELLVS